MALPSVYRGGCLGSDTAPGQFALYAGDGRGGRDADLPAPPPYSDWLTLRSPDLGNKDRLQFNRVSRESRGGTLVVFADPMWPKVQTQMLTFSGLKEQEARSLLDFMAAHLGLEVGYVDWEQRLWTGIITNPTEAMVQDGIGMFTVGFEFEGELVA